MRTVFFFAFILSASVVHAAPPVVVEPQDVSAVTHVENPEASWAYYGELNDFPHTYVIERTEPFSLRVEILEPDIEGAQNDHKGIIVRTRDSGRGVELVERLTAEAADWESFREPYGGDRYLQGPTYESELGPGTYFIEVSTAANEGKYVLVFGDISDYSQVGYFGKVARVYQVKRFFEKPPIAMIVSPLIYAPLIVLIVLVFLGRFMYKRKYA